MPSYDLSVAAFAAGATRKWLDNLTAQHAVPGVVRTRRGVKVEFTFDAVVIIWLAKALSDEFGMPVGRATEIAAKIQKSPHGTLQVPTGISVQIDLESVVRLVQQRLLEAAESVPRVRRGRPHVQADRTEGF